MRPYTVLGRRYYPKEVFLGETMYGVASWYGPDFHGKQTSSGEQYNMYALTAAHKTWPMNTLVRVRNLDNGRSCVVRINDRGPFVKARIIDCSYAAGKRLGLDRSGTAHVKLEVVGFAGKAYGKKAPTSHTAKRSAGSTLLRGYGTIALQAGAFSSADAAKRLANYLSEHYPGLQSVAVVKSKKAGDPVPYKVRLAGFGTANAARSFAQREGLHAFVVKE